MVVMVLWFGLGRQGSEEEELGSCLGVLWSWVIVIRNCGASEAERLHQPQNDLTSLSV